MWEEVHSLNAPDVDGLVCGQWLRRGGHAVPVKVDWGRPLPDAAVRAQKDMAGSVAGHYSARNEVILRLEFVNSKQTRVSPLPE